MVDFQLREKAEVSGRSVQFAVVLLKKKEERRKKETKSFEVKN